MCIAFFIALVSITYLRILFLRDKKIKKWNKFSFLMIGGEIGYIHDLSEERKNRYIKGMKVLKYSAITFLSLIIIFIITDVISAL